MCNSHPGLDSFRKNLRWEIAQPRLEQRANDIDVEEVGFVEEVDVKFLRHVSRRHAWDKINHTFVKAFLILLDLCATTGNSVETFLFTSTEIEVARQVSKCLGSFVYHEHSLDASPR